MLAEKKKSTPASLSISGPNVTLHMINTGWVKTKRRHKEFSGPGMLALPAIFQDHNWTDFMPIYVWAIEHKSGVILVDTGESIRSADPTYFECDRLTGLYYQSNLAFEVIDPLPVLLSRVGIRTEEVTTVVLTHMHSDHTGNLDPFSHSKFLVSDYSLNHSERGSLVCRWPGWFRPEGVKYKSGGILAFPKTQSITDDDVLLLVETPGHTLGHQSLLLKWDEERFLFLAGDTTFNLDQLERGAIPGINISRGKSARTRDQILESMQGGKLIYLPTHDPDNAQRLEPLINKTFHQVGNEL